jgi:N-ethylmaleimide reductase
VTSAVHAAGGRIFLQLWHVGRISHPSLQENGALPVSASPIRPKGQAYTYEGPQDFLAPRELDQAGIEAIFRDFERAAGLAKEAGFDGVEVHGANGYLIDQFLRDGTNKRKDDWGGSAPNRQRFALEALRAVLKVWEPQRVGIRLSPNNSFNDMYDSRPAETFGGLAEKLNDFGLAYLHLVESGDLNADRPLDRLFFRDRYKGALMVNGGYDLGKANAALDKGEADLISFGQLFIANPDLPRRLRGGFPLATADQASIYGGNEKGYIDYPAIDVAAGAAAAQER